jgi:SulP family sulfate permease
MNNRSLIFLFALILASVGLIESLMTLQLVDDITETRGNNNKECVGQGLANMVCGFFGAMGGCAMIGQSMINVNSGGRGRASGIMAALSLLFFIVLASTLIELIPIAALVGVMFMVVIGTFEWASLKLFRKIPKSDMINIVLVTSLTVIFDLAIAVFVGIIYAALQFAWMKSERIFSKEYIDDQGRKHYELKGPLFFGSVQSFIALFNPIDDPKEVVMDFADSKVCDYSSIEVINNIVDKYKKRDKIVYVKNLSPDCESVIKKAGNLFEGKIYQA